MGRSMLKVRSELLFQQLRDYVLRPVSNRDQGFNDFPSADGRRLTTEAYVRLDLEIDFARSKGPTVNPVEDCCCENNALSVDRPSLVLGSAVDSTVLQQRWEVSD